VKAEEEASGTAEGDPEPDEPEEDSEGEDDERAYEEFDGEEEGTWSEAWEEATITEMCRQAGAWIPPGGDGEAISKSMRALAKASIRDGAMIHGIHQAAAWGQGFEFDPALIEADEEYIRQAGGLAPAVIKRLRELDADESKGRLSAKRVNDMLSKANPEFYRLAALGTREGGVPVTAPPGFEPNSGEGQSLPRPSTREDEHTCTLRPHGTSHARGMDTADFNPTHGDHRSAFHAELRVIHKFHAGPRVGH
jgi:hypothetical protein